ncbi:hypothetical protein OIU83_22945 [Flavobacterium sp. LS1R49]|uniref:MORN repeat variant n=1 Tax=Flavobacterium shii TaxID=2987687 RepID=A0A9X3C096_9FLAO|nr:hypothetical protein [Flavobacterium shii]MCV9930536.1 hypothetical protein [Flavobacterium shii]
MKKKYIIIVFSVILGLIVLLFYFNVDKVYTLKEYSSTGKLIGTNEYVIKNGDTILHGKFINYDEKGIKIAEGQFVDGHIKGKCIYYYDNGKVETIQFKNGKITEESIYYNQDGLIENYTMYDDFGKSSFIISYDEKGVREYKGYPLLEVYQYMFTHKKQYNIKTEQVLKVGDTLKYQYLLANLPNTKRNFKVENMSADNEKVKRTIKHNPPTKVNVEEVLIKKGTNIIRAIVKYDFEDKISPAFNDTISFEVNVN